MHFRGTKIVFGKRSETSYVFPDFVARNPTSVPGRKYALSSMAIILVWKQAGFGIFYVLPLVVCTFVLFLLCLGRFLAILYGVLLL